MNKHNELRWPDDEKISASSSPDKSGANSPALEDGRLGWPWREIETSNLVSDARESQQLFRLRYMPHITLRNNCDKWPKGLEFFRISRLRTH